MDIANMNEEQFGQLVEQRLRAIHDNRANGNVNPRSTTQPGGPSTSEPSAVPAGRTMRGSVAADRVLQHNISREDAAGVMGFFRGVFNRDATQVRRSAEALGGSFQVERADGDPQAVGTPGSSGEGGVLVPDQFLAMVQIELPKFTPFADRSLIRIVPMAKETLKWPKVTSKPGRPVLTPEGTVYTKRQASFGLTELVARKIGEIIPFTEEIMESSEVSMVQLLAELVGEQMAYKRNELITYGTGVGEPEGVLTNGDVSSVAWVNTSDVTKADSIINIFYGLQSQYRRDCIWMMNDAIIKLVRKLKDAENRYLWTDGFADAPATLLGRPVYENPDISTTLGAGTDESVILFGNFRRGYVLGTKNGMSVSMDSSGDDWQKDITNMKFRERWDGKVNDVKAFVKGTAVK